jgi:hypothetical protein
LDVHGLHDVAQIDRAVTGDLQGKAFDHDLIAAARGAPQGKDRPDHLIDGERRPLAAYREADFAVLKAQLPGVGERQAFPKKGGAEVDLVGGRRGNQLLNRRPAKRKAEILGGGRGGPRRSARGSEDEKNDQGDGQSALHASTLRIED